MEKQEFSVFKSLADHHKTRKVKDGLWAGASGDKQLRAIQAWKYEKLAHVNRRPRFHNLRKETLTDATLEEWLQRSNPEPPHDAGALQGQLRILICHQTKKEAQRQYHMSAESYDLAEKHLRLPVQTLPNLASTWGIQSSEFIAESDRRGKQMTCLDITMNNTSIPEVPPCGVSLSYNFRTRTTTAFVKGTNAVKKDCHSHFQPWTIHRKLSKDLKATMPLWPHPLLLPILLLKRELETIRNFARKRLKTDARGIQNTMRMDYEDQAAILGGRNWDPEGREYRVQFMNGLNELLCSAHSIRRALGVARQAAGFMLGVLDEMRDYQLWLPGEKESIAPEVNQQIRDVIRTLDRGAAGFEVGIDSIVATLDVQLSTLSVVASQLDSKRSAEMSAQAGLDSVAMKTLALVTAVFLPATFLASLFSMSMFDWQSTTAVVSSKFWIFWAVAVPLSVVVLALWWWFWDLSRLVYAAKYHDADTSQEHETLWETWKQKHRMDSSKLEEGSRRWNSDEASSSGLQSEWGLKSLLGHRHGQSRSMGDSTTSSEDEDDLESVVVE